MLYRYCRPLRNHEISPLRGTSTLAPYWYLSDRGVPDAPSTRGGVLLDPLSGWICRRWWPLRMASPELP
jgi:hypothetical protein